VAADETPTIGVAMLGYSFMGKAHSRAFRALRELDPPLLPELVSLSGRNRDAAAVVAARYGWADVVTDWREQVADERVQLFDNGGPNAVHAEPTIAAARAGKHVFCEKPLGMDAEESHTIWRAAEEAGVVHQCGFNYRFVPAVRLARQMVESGAIGKVVHFRARYLQSWGWDAPVDDWHFTKAQAGSGALGDLGAHIIDLSRYLVGELATVSAEVKTYVGGHEVDDAFVAAVEWEDGTIGTLEASRLARGRVNSNAFEINGSDGSIAFDVERLNELQVSDGPGFRRVMVTEPDHPFMQYWWPPGHIIGWGDTFIHEFHHLLTAIAGGGTVAPHAATFEDGYRVAEVCDAILRSAASGKREPVTYR
jgi:predicted dehydrogenase